MSTESELSASNDTVARIKETVQTLKSEVAELQSRAGEGIKSLRERSDVYRQNAGEVIDSVAQYCKENPQQAAVIAGAAGLGVGIILGLLMRGGNK